MILPKNSETMKALLKLKPVLCSSVSLIRHPQLGHRYNMAELLLMIGALLSLLKLWQEALKRLGLLPVMYRCKNHAIDGGLWG